MPDLDPITGPAPATLSPALLAERLASERALREQSLAYERELRAEGRSSVSLLARQQNETHQHVHAAESNARDKALAGMDKRLEGMNEFRDQLRSQASTFLTIAVFDTWKEEYRRAHDELRGLIIDLQKADLGDTSTRRGFAKGQGTIIAVIIGSVSFATAAIGLIVIVANILAAR